MTYKEKISESMLWLSKQKDSVFIGEGLINAGRVYHTLDKVPLNKCLEMPIAENLIMGTAIGLAIEGFRPIVVFQRHDFLLIAADAIINHLALLPKMSGNQFTLPVIIRAIVGSQSKKFDVGEQHKHNFTYIFRPYITIVELKPDTNIEKVYQNIYKNWDIPTLVVEEKDDYEKEA